MNEKSVFHLMSGLTREEGISCILIGGFAVNYYKVTRQTADVDFLITEVDIKDTKFKELCLDYGDRGIYQKILEALK